MNQGQDCRHEFPVDTVCNHCEVMLSQYVQRLKARANQLEHLVIAANEQTRRLEEDRDAALLHLRMLLDSTDRKPLYGQAYDACRRFAEKGST